MRTSTAALALVVAVTSSAACTLFNNLDGYSGGLADTGTEPVVDTGTKDTFIPPVDTGAKTDGAVDGAMPDTSMVDTSVVDTSVTPMDTGTPVDSGGMPDTSVMDMGVPDAPTGCHVVVNELQAAGGTASDEFIELFNPCDAAIDLSGYKVVYRSATGSSDVLVATLAAGKSISAKGFFLVGNGTFASTADAPFSGIASLAASSGAAGVRDSTGALLDSVAYGAVTAGHAFIEAMPAPQPTAGASISRVPNGTDTNNNSVDFKPTASTPKS